MVSNTNHCYHPDDSSQFVHERRKVIDIYLVWQGDCFIMKKRCSNLVCTMKNLIYTLTFLLIVLGFGSELRGQFTPDRFTNRPLTLMNDATSVGWNPALLGMNGETDAVLVIPYDRTWQSNRLIGAFYSSQGIGLGYTSMRNERMPDFTFVPWSFYGGLGIKVPGYNVWTGASFRYSEFGGRTLRYSGSVIYNPQPRLYLSAGISNLNSVNTKDVVYELSTTYTPWDWLSMYGRLRYCADAPLHYEENHSTEFGISAAVNRRRIITSFSVNPVARQARFGLEVAFDVFSLGFLNDGSTLNNSGGRLTGGNILLRVNHDNFFSYDHYRYPKPICRTQRCAVRGCAGERCGDAKCPAYRCINVDCTGRPCTRRTCKGLVCPYMRSGGNSHSGEVMHGYISPGHTTEQQHIHGDVNNEHHVGHQDEHNEIQPPVYNGGNQEGHTHPVGCQYCGCGIQGHDNHGSMNGGNSQNSTTMEGNSEKRIEVNSVQAPNQQAPKVQSTKEVDDTDEDSWLDDEEESPKQKKQEEVEVEEEVEDPPFEEAEEPLSEQISPSPVPSTGKSIGKTYKLRKVFFDYDNYAIKDESREELNVLYSYLEKNTDLCVRLNAHTDSDGPNEYNLNLSQKRAQSVMDFLVAKGIDPIRLSAHGYGEELPVSSNDTPEGREQNRRVEFTQTGC